MAADTQSLRNDGDHRSRLPGLPRPGRWSLCLMDTALCKLRNNLTRGVLDLYPFHRRQKRQREDRSRSPR